MYGRVWYVRVIRCSVGSRRKLRSVSPVTQDMPSGVADPFERWLGVSILLQRCNHTTHPSGCMATRP